METTTIALPVVSSVADDTVNSSNTVLENGSFDLATIHGNQEFRASIKKLEESRKRLSRLNKVIRSRLSLGRGARIAEYCGKVISPLVPDKVREYLPASIIPFCSEEVDALALIEQSQRSNLTDIQLSLNAMATVARNKRTELDSLKMDIETARREEWDAERLQRYITTRAGIKLYDEVSRLLSSEFQTLPVKEKELRKEHLLARLDSNIEVGKTLMNMLVEVCLAGLETFHYATAEYHDYVHTYRPISVIRDAAKTLARTNETMYLGGDALVATSTESLKAIECVLDTARLTEQYSVASARSKEAFERGRQSLREKILMFRESQKENQRALSFGMKEEGVTAPEETLVLAGEDFK